MRFILFFQLNPNIVITLPAVIIIVIVITAAAAIAIDSLATVATAVYYHLSSICEVLLLFIKF